MWRDLLSGSETQRTVLTTLQDVLKLPWGLHPEPDVGRCAHTPVCGGSHSFS